MAFARALRSWLEVAADNADSRARVLRNCRAELDRTSQIEACIADLGRRVPRRPAADPVPAEAVIEQSA